MAVNCAYWDLYCCALCFIFIPLVHYCLHMPVVYPPYCYISPAAVMLCCHVYDALSVSCCFATARLLSICHTALPLSHHCFASIMLLHHCHIGLPLSCLLPLLWCFASVKLFTPFSALTASLCYIAIVGQLYSTLPICPVILCHHYHSALPYQEVR